MDNYPAAGRANDINVGSAGRVAPPKDPTMLERALGARMIQFDRLCSIDKRMTVLADRLLGGVPQAGNSGTERSDPGYVMGRMEGVDTAIESRLDAILNTLQRLEQL